MHMHTQACMHTCSPARTRIRAHARTHAHTHTQSSLLGCYTVSTVSEISVTTYQLTWHNTPQELSLHQQHYKYLKSQNIHSILSTKHTFSFQFKSNNHPLWLYMCNSECKQSKIIPINSMQINNHNQRKNFTKRQKNSR